MNAFRRTEFASTLVILCVTLLLNKYTRNPIDYLHRILSPLMRRGGLTKNDFRRNRISFLFYFPLEFQKLRFWNGLPAIYLQRPNNIYGKNSDQLSAKFSILRISPVIVVVVLRLKIQFFILPPKARKFHTKCIIYNIPTILIKFETTPRTPRAWPKHFKRVGNVQII